MKTVVINICGMKSERCLEGNHSMKWLYQKKTKGLKKNINNVRFCFKNLEEEQIKTQIEERKQRTGINKIQKSVNNRENLKPKVGT